MLASEYATDINDSRPRCLQHLMYNYVFTHFS